MSEGIGTRTEERWRRYAWRLVRETPVAPPVNVALDEVLTQRVGAGERAPTLRFWGRFALEVVIGRFQSVRNEVDEEEARRRGIEVIRRTTGGGATFVRPPDVITYSIHAPLGLVAGMTAEESYAFLDAWVVEALRSLGIDAYYEPINDISSAGGKIGGAAQARSSGAVLHHATMAYDIDAAAMLRVLRVGEEKLSDKAIRSAEKRVGPLKRQTRLPREEIVERMIETFSERNTANGLVEDRISPEELAETEKLARTRYGSEDWLRSVP